MGKYTLIVTEKPDAAKRIASALDIKEKPRKMEENKVPYYVAMRDRKIVVVPALGHLYTVAPEKSGRNSYPVFSLLWAPRHVTEKGARRVRVWLEVISKLAKNADMFIDACDYDIEGSVIGYNILKYACGNKEQTSKRMKYSTLTKEELEKSYVELQPHLDFALIEAGRTRHEVDWLFGVNLTRALTISTKNHSGKYATISTGRVQGPTLRFLVQRERNIKSFVPTPYWEIKAEAEIDGQIFEAEHARGIIETKKEANDILKACKGKDGQVKKIDIKKFQQSPPVPFDLGSLQGEAYSLFRYNPKHTSTIAQRLYLDALISYPRTSSQKLPPAIGYKTILQNLNRLSQYTKLTSELLSKSELRPNEGRKDDPAHPAIYPTGKQLERYLDKLERNIWDLIIRRFMAVFGEPATKQSIRIAFRINENGFYLRGKQILKDGWLRFYKPYIRSEEIFLPQMREGQTIRIKKIVVEDKFTSSPPRYNSRSLLKKMERAEIGTKATRADTVQTLYDRKYCRDNKIIVTDLGFEVLEVLENYCPIVVSVNFTRELEEKMNRIQTHNENREDTIESAIEILKPVTEKLKTCEKEIGEQLSNAIKRAEVEEKTIGVCPICNTGKLTIIYSRKTGKRFVGCTNYFKGLCKTAFPLPQKGTIKALGKNCARCGWPQLQVRISGGYPWTLCLNPKCPFKEERRKKIEMRNM